MNKKFTYIFLLFILMMASQSCKEMSTLTATGGNPASKNSNPVSETVEPTSKSLNVKVPSVIEINQCVPLVISLKNHLNEQVTINENLNLVIQGNSSLLFSDSNCLTSQASSFVYNSNLMSKIIYAKTANSQSYVYELSEASNLVKPFSLILSVTNPLANTESLRLSLSGPTSLVAGQCRSYVVNLQNTLGVNRTSANNLSITLGGEGSGGTFYSGANCIGGAISNLLLPSGSSYISFSYKNNVAENVNFNIDSPIGSEIQSAFFSVQVQPIINIPPTELVLSGPSSVTTGVCSGPVIVRSVDAALSSAVVSSNLNFTVSGGAGFNTYTNSSCSNSLISPTITTGASSTSFYYIMNNPGSFTITADDGASLTDASLSVQAVASSGTSPVKLSLVGPTNLNALTCSSAFLVKTVNGSGVDSPVSASTLINLTGKGSGDFYADSACSTMVSSLNIGAGDSSLSFYYKGSNVSNLTFNVDDVGSLTPASLAVSVVADTPNKLVLNGPSPIVLGECRAYTVTTKDSNDFVSVVSSTTVVNLTGAGVGTFYSDSSCVNSVSSLVINPGQANGLFYYKSMSEGSVNLSSDSSGTLLAGTKSVTIDPLPYSKIQMSRPALSAGNCSSVIISLKDSLNNTSLATSAVGISLSSTGNLSFHTTSNCVGGLITSTTIPISQSSATVYVKDDIAESIQIIATSTGLTSDTWNTNVIAGPGSGLKLNGPATANVGSCISYDLKLEDAFSNLTNSSNTFSINFSGLSNARFYSDVNCTSLISSTSMPVGTSTLQLFLKGNVAESLNISASASGLTAATKNITLLPGSSNKLTINSVSTITAGDCSILNINVKDNFDNLINQSTPLSVTMSGNTVGSFYSDSGCTAATSNVTIGVGSSSSNVWFKSNAPSSLVLSAQALAVFDASKNISIIPQTPSKLTLNGPTNISANTCTAYSISLQDTLNNLSSVGSPKNLTLSGAGAGAFFSDSSCSVPTSSIPLTSSQNTAQIFYKANSAQTTNLLVDDSGLPDLVSATIPVTVISSGVVTPVALRINGATSVNVDTCVPYAVMTTDNTGFTHTLTSDLTIGLAGAGSGVFYSDNTCSTAQPNLTILSGSSLGYIYFKSSTPQNLVFSVTASGASSTTIPVAVVNEVQDVVASKLTIVGSTSILTNSCIPYVVSSADSSGNSKNVTTNTVVSLLGAGSGDFFTDNTCTTSLSGNVTILSGTSYSTIYYSNSVVQNLIFIAQSSGLSNGTLAVGISSVTDGAVSGPAVKLSFVAQPSSIGTAGESLSVQPTIVVQDTNNNVANTSNATITLSAFTDSSCSLSAGAVLSATTNPLNANGGVASFSSLNVSSPQTIYIKATSPGLVSACSNAIQVYPAVAAKLAFTVQPSLTAIAGNNLVMSPSVSVLNHTNGVVTNATNVITIGAYLDSACTNSASGVFNVDSNSLIPNNGVATFSGINYSLPQTVYLKASSSGLNSACSAGISISPAAPYRIGVFNQPAASGEVGVALSLTVRLYDIFGSLSPAAHNLTLTAYKSNNCTGTTTPVTGNAMVSTLGTANFASVTFTQTGIMSIKISDATDTDVLSVCTTPISVDGSAPAKLVFSTQPSTTGRAYTTLVNSPIVQVQDTFSNVVEGSINLITLTAFTDNTCTTAASGTLYGENLSLSPSFGEARFNSISYSKNETIYLKATSPGLTSACSNAITITGTPAKMATRDNTTCMIMSGEVWCWGDNTYNKLANNQGYPYHSYPTQVVGVGGVGVLSNITDIAIGMGHACALSTTGQVFCWGRNDYGQIGDNTVVNKATPVQVLGVGGVGNLSNIISITASYLHSCALNVAGNTFCWGYNAHGQMGDNTTTHRYTPVQVMGVGAVGVLSNITAISSGDYHACALNNAGAMYCWGYNGYGQMGDGTTTQRYTPIQVKGVAGVGNLSNIVNMSAGGHGSYGFNCAVDNTGSVYCWGYGGNYNMGDLGASSRYTPVQVKGVGGVGSLANISSVSAGGYHACAVNNAGNTYCWGYNAQSQIGNNSTTAVGSPVLTPGVDGVGNLSNIIGIVAGSHNTCAYAKTGEMYCWGYNLYGQAGDHSTAGTRVFPVQVRDINTSNFTSISVGYFNVCGVAREKVYCWGYGANGELGDGTTTGKFTPALVSNLSGVKQVSMGQNHGCALTKTGNVYCWGYNAWGQLGDNATTSRTIPNQVLGVGGVGFLTDIISISASNFHTCAVKSNGAVYCWGNNGNGQLGDNSVTERRTPVQVVGENGVGFLSNIVAVDAGYHHTCAQSSSGAMYCWGYNGYGQLGDNTSVQKQVPNQVSGMSSGVTAISSGHMSTCAIKNGAGYCWGHTSYANTNTSYHSISGSNSPGIIWPSGVTSISAGTETVSAIVNNKVRVFSPVAYYAYHAVNAGDSIGDVSMISESGMVYGHPMYCALKNSGDIFCWGYNAYFPLFNIGYNGSITYPSAILQPKYNDKIHSQVTTGESHSCANINGMAQCWGTSNVGALGNGLSHTVKPMPVKSSSTNANIGGQLELEAGANHTCSLSFNGEVHCWGDNTFGKLGNNSTVASTKAVKVFGPGGVGVLRGVSSIGVGYRHNCAVSLGTTYCWGNNGQGQLGNNSNLSMASPVAVKGVNGVGLLTGVTKVTSGREHSCAIKSGNVYCWGSNLNGQLGANSMVDKSNTPVQVVSVAGVGPLENVSDLSAGAYHTCALSEGIVYCWGLNTSRQLGNDGFQDSSYPVGVMNSGYVTLTAVNSIKSGQRHTCATTSIGEAYCWGAGVSGQLGNNSNLDIGVATNVLGEGAVGSLSSEMIGSGSSSNHTCSINPGFDKVHCWGNGANGQLGDGSTLNRLSPVEVVIPNQLNLIVR